MVGFDLVLVAFIICVLGGIGSIPGAILGSFIIALIETFSGFFIAESMKQVVYFVIFILILIIKPSGLLGKKGEAFLHR
jgi:branched-chain amino acid transport system permease protein